MEAARAAVKDATAAFDAKVQYSGMLVKKGGQQGQKGEAERWFAIEEFSPGVWAMEYHDPKTFKLLGQIPIDNQCICSVEDMDHGKKGMLYHLNVTCQQEGRTYYMHTPKRRTTHVYGACVDTSTCAR